jgi:cell division transport system ATP-binding protein
LGPEVLRDLTFRIDPHSFQFLTGPSGAGKTSLLRLLFLSMRPTRGLITQFGHDVATLSRDAVATLRRRIGIVFQDFRLLDHMTTYENVALPLRVSNCCLPMSPPGTSIRLWRNDYCGCSLSSTSQARQ